MSAFFREHPIVALILSVFLIATVRDCYVHDHCGETEPCPCDSAE